MKYLIEYFNIQGFVGYHSFTLGKGINFISSKYNGTGKSTLFDCLRLLAVRGNHDNDELYYMINHNALDAFFRMTTGEGESYGFYMNKEKGSFLYTRKLPEDETIEYSAHPFPEMWEKLNLFVKAGNYVNIADRFIDLFSSSNITFNSGLVQELMLHEETEKVYAELLARMEFSKDDMTKKFAEANTLMIQKDLLPFYPKLVALYNLLYNEELVLNYETMVDILEEVRQLQQKLSTIYIDYSYTHLFKVKEFVAQLTPTSTPVDLSAYPAMVSLARLRQDVLQLFPVSKEVSPKTISNLSLLVKVKANINTLELELPPITIPRGLLSLKKLSETMLELQEEKSLVRLDSTNASTLLSLTRDVNELERFLPLVDHKLHKETASTLLDLQQLIKDVQSDKEAELYNQQEYEKVQGELDGVVCPTCKSVLKRGRERCEHLS